MHKRSTPSGSSICRAARVIEARRLGCRGGPAIAAFPNKSFYRLRSTGISALHGRCRIGPSTRTDGPNEQGATLRPVAPCLFFEHAYSAAKPLADAVRGHDGVEECERSAALAARNAHAS